MQDEAAAKKRVRTSRVRTNVLKESEFRTIEFLCKHTPNWITPNMMTVVGMLGSAIIALGLFLAQSKSNDFYLLLSIIGFAVQWYGDSMDGRLAYYRNKARKWYGWSLDIMADWISTFLTSVGIYFYFPEMHYVALLFLFAYLGTMIVTLLKFSLTVTYSIDSGLVGPTELRIITCLMFLLQLVLPGTLLVFAFVAPASLMFVNYLELQKVLKLGDAKDKEDQAKKKDVPQYVEESV
jgi:phosphatidylglycerophosphate synthase